ncbi:MAG: 7-cyano-7-deazaguanine synthase [Phycisphaerae bacterium]
MESAIVLTGGGIKSAVAAACVAKTHRITLLHVNFGQRAAEVELDAIRRLVEGTQDLQVVHVDMNYPLQLQQQIAGTFGVEQQLENGAGLVGSTVLDGAGLSGTWGSLVWAGAQAAVRKGARRLVSGLSGVEGAVHLGLPSTEAGIPGLQALAYDLNACIRFFCGSTFDIELDLPLLHRSYTEVIKLGVHLGVDFERTWTCVSPPTSRGRLRGCDRCVSCRTRTKAFADARFTDPFDLVGQRARV